MIDLIFGMTQSGSIRALPSASPFPAALLGTALPGADMIERGLADLAVGERTAESLLLQVGAPRLRALGIDIPYAAPSAGDMGGPEIALYRQLPGENPDAAHSRYNALLRALVSFERAAESVVR
ncbi:MAG TPA: hypothetical protein VII66_08860 [Gemmatimonadaceae bacterium]